MDKVEKFNSVVKVLEALEPWLLQLIKFNPEEEHLRPARNETAHRLIALVEEIEGG